MNEVARNFDPFIHHELCALSAILSASWISCKNHAKGGSPPTSFPGPSNPTT